MAYRELALKDTVRIVDRGQHHGANGVVTAVSKGFLGDLIQVEGTYLNYKIGKTVDFNVWVHPNKLIITDVHPLPVIQYPERYHENDDDEPDEPCGSCSCCNWHHANS